MSRCWKAAAMYFFAFSFQTKYVKLPHSFSAKKTACLDICDSKCSPFYLWLSWSVVSKLDAAEMLTGAEQSQGSTWWGDWDSVGGWHSNCVSLKKSVFMWAAGTFALQSDLELSLAELMQLPCRPRWILSRTYGLLTLIHNYLLLIFFAISLAFFPLLLTYCVCFCFLNTCFPSRLNLFLFAVVCFQPEKLFLAMTCRPKQCFQTSSNYCSHFSVWFLSLHWWGFIYLQLCEIRSS